MGSDAEGDREDRPRTFFEHLEELRRRLKVVLISVLLTFAILLVIGFEYFTVGGVGLWLPVPLLSPENTIPSQVFRALLNAFVPPFVEPVVLTPWEAVIIQFKVALYLAILVTSPIITFEFWRFVSPGLTPKERRFVFRVSAPVVLLFLAGVAMSFLVVLPFTFPFLYGIAVGIGARPLLQLQEFLDFVLLFSLGFGIAFELPVVMYGLSAIGLVNPSFWSRNWRFATIGIFAFGAFITPDGSGITMMLVALPMLALYVGGYVVVRWKFGR